MICAKPPFSGPEAVLAYLSLYTHRVAISNRRLISLDNAGVTFRYKDYRRDGADRQRIMTLGTDEFIRRFLLHVLPKGFHRIRHYGLLASAGRETQRRAGPATARCPSTGWGRGNGAATGCRQSAVPCCWRSHGHHRDLRRAARARAPPSLPSLCRDDPVVNQDDEPPPAAEAMRPRQLDEHAPVSITSSTTALMTARSRYPPHRRIASMPRSRTALSVKHPPTCGKLAIAAPAIQPHQKSQIPITAFL